MKKILVIYIRCTHELLSISGREQFLNDRMALDYYEDLPISFAYINDNCLELFKHLNSADKCAKIDRSIIERIKDIGHSLYDHLFTLDLKKLLNSTKCQDLILKIDSNLVQIPWELLFDGNNFLCQRFSMGRRVSTKQTISHLVIRKAHKPFKMLILADPKGDLEASYEEGVILKEKFNNLKTHIAVNLKTTSIETESIKRSLRRFDILHYAGHATYNKKDPSLSGWQTVDGLLSTTDITKMISVSPMPLLIFSNACRSGQTAPWDITTDGTKSVYGLANAFLLSGVQHYIGTFWNIPDKIGLRLAVEFYQNLLEGKNIGQSLQNARLHLIERYGEENTTWMAYMLYGDPTYSYFNQNSMHKTANQHKEKIELNNPKNINPDLCKTMRGDMNVKISSKKLPFHKISPLKAALSLLFIISIVLGTLMIFKSHIQIPFANFHATPNNTSSNPYTKNFPGARDPNRIDNLIKDIETRLKDREIIEHEDEWTSRPLTMVVFGYRSRIENKNTVLRHFNDILVQEITTSIQSHKAIPLVDRKHLDKVLREHQLTLSDLANRKQALVLLGRLLQARLIMFSEIIPYNKKYKLYLHVIETETSLIKVAFDCSIEKEEDHELLGAQIAQRVIKEIKNHYPLRGKITAISDSNTIRLNFGSDVGLREGFILKVIGKIGEPQQRGQLEIIGVEQDFALARIIEADRTLVCGDRVIVTKENLTF